MSLKNKAISGIKWTTFSTVIVTLFQILQLAILARYLEPSDFGLMALVMVVIGFSQAFLDMGVSNAIIYKQKITSQQLSTLYWLNVLSGFVLFGIITICAPFVAALFKETELTQLIIVVGLTFVIQPFGMQFMVLWKKDLKFNEIARIKIISKFFSLIFTVYLAYENYGVYALVYGVLLGAICQTAFYLYKGLKVYKPSFIFNVNDIREFLTFGFFQIGEKSINYFTRQIDSIIIGKLLGVDALGLYHLVKQVVEKSIYIINGIFNNITFPVFSKIQNDHDKLKLYYLKLLHILTLIQFPLIMTQFYYGYDIMLLILGNKWQNTETLVKLFAIYSLFLVYGNPVGNLLLSKGKANWGFYTNIIFFVLYTLSVYFFTSRYGLNGALFGFIFICVISMIPIWKMLVSKLISVTLFEYYKSFVFQLTITAFSTSIAFYFSSSLYDTFLMRIIVYTFIALILYVPLNILVNKSLFKELMSLGKV